MNGNGTGTELVPVLDMGNGNGTSSTFEKKNGTERSSKNFGTGPITGLDLIVEQDPIVTF